MPLGGVWGGWADKGREKCQCIELDSSLSQIATKKMQDAVNSTELIVHVKICKTAETQMEWDREWEDQLILQVKIEFRLNFFNLTLIIHELGLGVKGNWESN